MVRKTLKRREKKCRKLQFFFAWLTTKKWKELARCDEKISGKLAGDPNKNKKKLLENGLRKIYN